MSAERGSSLSRISSISEKPVEGCDCICAAVVDAMVRRPILGSRSHTPTGSLATSAARGKGPLGGQEIDERKRKQERAGSLSGYSGEEAP